MRLESRAEKGERKREREREGGSFEKIPVTVCAGGRRFSRA